MSHFKAKMHQIRFLASVRLSLCPFVSRMEFDTEATGNQRACFYTDRARYVLRYVVLTPAGLLTTTWI